MINFNVGQILKIKKLRDTATIPKYETEGAVGFDICSDTEAHLVPGGTAMLTTGIAFEIPKGYAVSIRQRSGLSRRYPNYLAIGVGTIDWDYRGEIMVPVVNNNEFEVFDIMPGDRIVQGIFHPVIQAKIKVVNELNITKRAEGGFGHTGV